MEKGKRLLLLISLTLTAFALAFAALGFLCLDRFTDVSQSVFGYGLMFFLTLCKPTLIAYAALAALYVALAVVIVVTKRGVACVSALLLTSAICSVFFLVTQPLLWIIATKSPVLIAAALLSEIAFIANFAILNSTYKFYSPKKSRK